VKTNCSDLCGLCWRSPITTPWPILEKLLYAAIIKLLLFFTQAAYRDNTLGLPKLSPADNVAKIDRSILYTYLKNHYTPERMVVAGVGVDHDKLVESVSKYFVDTLPIWEQDKTLAVAGHPGGVDSSIAQYTGGLVQVN